MLKAVVIKALLMAVILSWAAPAGAETAEGPPVVDRAAFAAWLADFRAEALARGISPATLERTLTGLEPLPVALARDRRQPEFRLTLDGYLRRTVTDKRIARGRELLGRHRALLEKVRARWGVQPRFLVAFWALESNFGDYTGDFPVIPAVATLAFDPRRGDFFREQLHHALRIVDGGHIAPERMTGSWAGAMGQLQFIPSTFTGYAVDFDGDGRRDLWTSLPDIFASAANYLAASGWDGARTWGREVLLPEGFDWRQAGRGGARPLARWQDLGVRRADGRDLPQVDIEGAVLVPAGHRGPAFMVYGNYRATLAWNNSSLYALAIGHLADRIAGGGPLVTKRDYREEPLRRSDIEEMQRLLTRLGHDPGGVDGLAGRQTRAALRAFQAAEGQPADGHPSAEALAALRLAAGQAQEARTED